MSFCTLAPSPFTPTPSPTHTPPPPPTGTQAAALQQLHKTAAAGLPWLRALHQVEVGGMQQAGRFILTLPEDHQLEPQSGQSAAASTVGGVVTITGTVALLTSQSPAGFAFLLHPVCSLEGCPPLHPASNPQQQVLLPPSWPSGCCCWSATVQTRSPGYNMAAHSFPFMELLTKCI